MRVQEVFVRAEGPVLALAGCVGSDRVVYVRDDDEGVPEICIVSLNSDDTKFITRQGHSHRSNPFTAVSPSSICTSGPRQARHTIPFVSVHSGLAALSMISMLSRHACIVDSACRPHHPRTRTRHTTTEAHSSILFWVSCADDPDLVAYDSIALSADGTRLVTADTSPSSVVIVWDLTTPEPVEIKRKALPTAGPYQVSVCPENHDQFAAVSAEHILKFQLEFCGELTALTHTETRVQVSTRITRRGSLLGKLGRRNSVTSMLHLDKCVHTRWRCALHPILLLHLTTMPLCCVNRTATITHTNF